MEIKRTSLVLSPECYQLWALSPDLLLTHNLIMDERDFEEAQLHKSLSSYHQLIAEALRIYREEGMIKLQDYPSSLSKETRQLIHDYAEQLLNKQKENDLLEYGRYAYKEYAAYQTKKLEFMRIDEPQFVEESTSRSETMEHLNRLEKARTVPADFNFTKVMTRIIAKTLAGMHLSGKLNLPLHDTEEYKQAVIWILKDCLLENKSGAPTIVHAEPTSFNKMLVQEVFSKLIHPEIVVKDTKSLPMVITTRSDFDTLGSLLAEIDVLYKEALNIYDKQNLLERALADIVRIEESIEKEVEKIQSSSGYRGTWGLFKILASMKLPGSDIIENKLKGLSRQRIRSNVEKKHTAYSWFFSFKKISKRSLTITDFPKSQSKGTQKRIETWLRGDVPWYEKPDEP